MANVANNATNTPSLKTEIIMITDRSGSMSSIKRDAEGGFNNFIEEQKKVGGEVRVTSVIFDSQVETQYEKLDLQAVPQFTLMPRGSTALQDAIGQTLNVQGKRIHDENWADLVIVTILTDGEENASREYSAQQIKEMITHAEQHNWKFIFLAANQDAFQAGAAYGISANTTRGFAANAAGTKSAYADISSMTTALRTHA